MLPFQGCMRQKVFQNCGFLQSGRISLIKAVHTVHVGSKIIRAVRSVTMLNCYAVKLTNRGLYQPELHPCRRSQMYLKPEIFLVWGVLMVRNLPWLDTEHKARDGTTVPCLDTGDKAKRGFHALSARTPPT